MICFGFTHYSTLRQSTSGPIETRVIGVSRTALQLYGFISRSWWGDRAAGVPAAAVAASSAAQIRKLEFNALPARRGLGVPDSPGWHAQISRALSRELCDAGARGQGWMHKWTLTRPLERNGSVA